MGRSYIGPIARIGLGACIVTLASVSSAHAHGGLAAPSELGPPLLTSGAIGVVCYWLVMLWPSRKSKRPAESGPIGGKFSGKIGGKSEDSSGNLNGNLTRNNKRNGTRRSQRGRAKPRLKMVATTSARNFQDRAESEGNAVDV
jgi:hypothetical protein